MAEAISGTAPTDWHIPPENQSGDVSRTDRKRIKRELQGSAVWVARNSEPREKQLIDILGENCRKMKISPVPKLLIYSSKKPNAGSSSTRAILFSTSLLEIMPPDQVKAIMAHELVHHKHHFSDRIKDLAVDFGLIFAYCVVREHLKNVCEKFASSKFIRYGTDAIVIAGLQIAGLWRSRQREYRSDRGGAEVAGTDAMINSLDIIHKRSNEILQEEEQQGKSHYWLKHAPEFLKSHPSYDKRIARLQMEASQSFLDKHLNEPAAETTLAAR